MENNRLKPSMKRHRDESQSGYGKRLTPDKPVQTRTAEIPMEVGLARRGLRPEGAED